MVVLSLLLTPRKCWKNTREACRTFGYAIFTLPAFDIGTKFFKNCIKAFVILWKIELSFCIILTKILTFVKLNKGLWEGSMTSLLFQMVILFVLLLLDTTLAKKYARHCISGDVFIYACCTCCTFLWSFVDAFVLSRVKVCFLF